MKELKGGGGRASSQIALEVIQRRGFFLVANGSTPRDHQWFDLAIDESGEPALDELHVAIADLMRPNRSYCAWIESGPLVVGGKSPKYPKMILGQPREHHNLMLHNANHRR